MPNIWDEVGTEPTAQTSVWDEVGSDTMSSFSIPDPRALNPSASLGFMEPAAALPKLEVSPNESFLTAFGKTVANAGISIPEFFTSPSGMIAMGTSAVAPTATTAVFTADMARNAAKELWDVGKHLVKDEPGWTAAEWGARAGNLFSSALFTYGLGKATYRGAVDFAKSRMVAPSKPVALSEEKPIGPGISPEPAPVFYREAPTGEPGTTALPSEPSAAVQPSTPVVEPTAARGVTAPQATPPSRTTTTVVEPSQLSKREQFIQNYLALARRVRAAEKTPGRPLTKEEQDLAARDWKAFSRQRGYTEGEIGELDLLQQMYDQAPLFGVSKEELPGLERADEQARQATMALPKPVYPLTRTPTGLVDNLGRPVDANHNLIEPETQGGPSAIPIESPTEVHVQPTPRDRGAVDQGVREAGQEPARAQGPAKAEAQAPRPEVAPAGAQGEVRGEVAAATERESIRQDVLRDIEQEALRPGTTLGPSKSKYLYHISDVLEPIVEIGLRAGGLSGGAPVSDIGFGHIVHVFLRSDVPEGISFSDVALRGLKKPLKPIASFTVDELGLKQGIGERARELGYEVEPEYEPTEKEKLLVKAREDSIRARIEQAYQKRSSTEPGVASGFRPGPGAQTTGAPQYPAIRQLSDQLRQTSSPSLRTDIPLKERTADAWAKGKSAAASAVATMRAVSESIANTFWRAPQLRDLDRRVGELDWALQQSVASSAKAKKLLRKTYPNQTMRDAVAIWVDTPGDPAAKQAAIRTAIGALPKGTSARVRRALAMAANLPREAADLADMVEQFYGVRLTDALGADVLDRGLEDYYTHIWKSEDNMPDSLRAALTNGRVRTYFQYAQKRKIGTFLEGILAGKEPLLDPAEVVPYYNYAMDRAIASRKFIKELSETTEDDGRPTVAPAGRSGPIDPNTVDSNLVIRPKAPPKPKFDPTGDILEEYRDYETVNHPALRKWKWAGKAEGGGNVLYESDLKVHPAAYQRLRRMMDRGVLTPSPTTRTLLKAGSVPKSLMFGLLSTFHQVHVGLHAAFHWTNPFRAAWKPIDWDAPATQYAVEKGHLKLAPDPGELSMFREGLVAPELIKKIPGLGQWSEAYSDWLFHEFIPRLKLATFENAFQRGKSKLTATGRGLARGAITEEQVAARIGDSVNNAFGELNKLWLGKHGRMPWVQRLLQFTFLAPDFGEARVRFAGKALTRYGTEERLALATMFITLYGTARIANWLSHGDPETGDLKNAFRVKVGNHWWSLRSIVGDIDHAITDIGHFMRVRLSPMFGRTIYEILSGRDVRGQKLSPIQAIGPELAKRFVPIGMSGFTRNDQKLWESFVGSMGATAQRETPMQAINRMFYIWKEDIKDPKIQNEIRRSKGETRMPSDYFDLRQYLLNNDMKSAQQAYTKLMDQGKTPGQIADEFNPRLKDGTPKPIIRNKSLQGMFLATLNDRQMKIYDEAVAEREELWRRFQSIWSGR